MSRVEYTFIFLSSLQPSSKQIELAKLKIEMAMPLEMAMHLTKTVWFALSGWIFTCLCIADEIAGSLRNRELSLSMSDD